MLQAYYNNYGNLFKGSVWKEGVGFSNTIWFKFYPSLNRLIDLNNLCTKRCGLLAHLQALILKYCLIEAPHNCIELPRTFFSKSLGLGSCEENLYLN